MQRRSLLTAFASIAAALTAAASRAEAGIDERDSGLPKSGRLKVVYHLNELDRVVMVLGNIANHMAGVGGPENVAIALVVHGPALRAFQATATTPDIKRRVNELLTAGVSIAVCANTMKTQSVAQADLLPGLTVAAQGGMVRIADLQSQGYLYIRP